MSVPHLIAPKARLIQIGLKITNDLHYQLTPEQLVRDTLRRKEGVLSDTGALVIRTGEFTGRSPKDRYIVKDEITTDNIHWNEFNQPLEEKYFDTILTAVTTYLEGQPELWVRDCYVCADPRHRLADIDLGGVPVSAAITAGPITGCQFHPEKSGEVGLAILRAFVARG